MNIMTIPKWDMMLIPNQQRTHTPIIWRILPRQNPSMAHMPRME